jgi:hypothetical protein
LLASDAPRAGLTVGLGTASAQGAGGPGALGDGATRVIR